MGAKVDEGGIAAIRSLIVSQLLRRRRRLRDADEPGRVLADMSPAPRVDATAQSFHDAVATILHSPRHSSFEEAAQIMIDMEDVATRLRFGPAERHAFATELAGRA